MNKDFSSIYSKLSTDLKSFQNPKVTQKEKVKDQKVKNDFTNVFLAIKTETVEFLKNFNGVYPSLHNELQRYLKSLAPKYKYSGALEYPVKMGTNRKGRIDLVWKKKKTKFLAIEIDFTNRKRSIQKLVKINADYCIWIYMGNVSPLDDLKRLDPHGKIHLIWLKYQKRRKMSNGAINSNLAYEKIED